MGSYSFCINVFVESAVWYAAPSKMITELLRQSGSSAFSFSTRCRRNIPNICLLEFAYAKLIHALPSESSAASIVTLGTKENAATELSFPSFCHFILRKSDIPSQVSSMQMILVPSGRAKKVSAHCCRRTRLLSLLPFIGMCITFLNFIPSSTITYLMK